MAYSNWKNPFDSDNDIPEVPDDWYVWYNNYQETPKQVTTNYADYTRTGQPVMWNAPSGPIKGPQIYNWAKENNLFEPILKWPSPMPKATPPNPQPTRTLKQMVYPTTNKQLSAYEQTRGAFANSQRLTAQAGAYQQQQVQNAYSQRLTAQAQRSVGNASARATGDAWKAKYYQYFDQNRARLAEAQRMTSQANAFLDVNVAPPSVTTGGGSGGDYWGGGSGYYSYGGGGSSYKPQPKPWYMSLTNWRI